MEKRCKKCGKVLPSNTKYKTCEACRGKRIDSIKDKIEKGGGLAAVGVTLYGIARFIKNRIDK